MTNTASTASTTGLEPRTTAASPIAPLLAVDGYKHSHRQVYPQGTTRILINWTNRSNAHMPESTHAVVFGLQAFVQRYLVEAWAPFFAADEDEVARAKSSLQAGAVKARDSLSAPARIVGRALATGSTIEDIEAWPERIGAVTAAQVQAAAKAVFDPDYSVTGLLLPKAGK